MGLQKRTVDLSMQGYVSSKLKEFDHPKPAKAQHSPYPAPLWFEPSQNQSQKIRPKKSQRSERKEFNKSLDHSCSMQERSI